MVLLRDKTAVPYEDEVWTLDWIARSSNVQIVGGGLHDQFKAIETDSRSLSPSSVFLALKGERFDGHDYVADVLKAGAVAAIVDAEALASHPEWKELGTLVVTENTLSCYGDIAGAWRRERARSRPTHLIGCSTRSISLPMSTPGLSARKRTAQRLPSDTLSKGRDRRLHTEYVRKNLRQ